MLSRAAEKVGPAKVHFVIGDVRRLPFPADSFDLITISFATRNINLSRPILIEEIEEFRRVLKPGGVFVNLETSQPRLKLIRTLFHAYVKRIVKTGGRWLSGSRAGYAYLASTIPRFYSPDELSAILERSGLETLLVKRLSLGIAAIHIARKPEAGLVTRR
jgi:demethylmenaquinone methyltransferase/2-methoxy-6-polyprenyl-1,4-benzoquinol methylase